MKRLYLAFISISLVTSNTFFASLGGMIRGAGDAAADVVSGTAHVAGDTVDVVTGNPRYYHSYGHSSVVGKEAGHVRARNGYDY